MRDRRLEAYTRGQRRGRARPQRLAREQALRRVADGHEERRDLEGRSGDRAEDARRSAGDGSCCGAVWASASTLGARAHFTWAAAVGTRRHMWLQTSSRLAANQCPKHVQLRVFAQFVVVGGAHRHQTCLRARRAASASRDESGFTVPNGCSRRVGDLGVA